jgi:hypothetical protein
VRLPLRPHRRAAAADADAARECRKGGVGDWDWGSSRGGRDRCHFHESLYSRF